MKTVRVIMAILGVASAASAESLWAPSFKGYLTGSTGLAAGDALVVQVDASSSLSFTSSRTDAKTLTLEFSGGEAGDLFSFLPQVRTSGDLGATGKDVLSLSTTIPVTVTAVAADGSAQVQGTRTIAVEGKSSSLTVSGTVARSLLAQRGVVSFSRLSNARLSYTTLLGASRDVLAAADLQKVVAAASAAAAPAGTPATSGAAGTVVTGAPQAAAAATGSPGSTQNLAIPEARRKELLLLYLNRLLDVIFAP